MIKPDSQFENIQEAVKGAWGGIFNHLLIVKGGTQVKHLLKYFEIFLTGEFLAKVACYVLFSSAKANVENNPTDYIKIRFIRFINYQLLIFFS